QLCAELVLPHPEYVKQSTVPEGLFIQTDLCALIEIYRHAHPAQGEVALGPPPTPGLSVARRLSTENSFYVGEAWPFPPFKLVRSFEVAEVDQVLRRRRMHAVPIRVIADRVLRKRSDDIGAASRLQHAGLLPHHFESRSDSLGGQILCDPKGGIVR